MDTHPATESINQSFIL